MKELYIIRHAKSSWSKPNLSDMERPLNKRGIHDAPKMAEILNKKLEGKLDLIYSSPAARAISTAQVFQSAFMNIKEIDVRTDIYNASIEDVMHIIQTTDNDKINIAIFGHNPTFTYLLNYLASANIENLPTCGIAILTLNSDNWEDLHPTNIQLKELLLPKKLLY